MTRRRFLGAAGSTAAMRLAADAATQGVSIAIDPADTVASTAPAQWAAKELEQALSAQGVAVHRWARVADAKAGDRWILAAASSSVTAKRLLNRAVPRVSHG